MHQPGEPSVELLLDRIKKVIARENERTGEVRGVAADPARPARHPAGEDRVTEPVDPEEAAEVLDLEEDEIVTPPPYSAAQDDTAAIPLAGEYDDDLIEYGWAEAEAEAPLEADLSAAGGGQEHEADTHGTTEPLASTQTAAATRETLAALSVLSALTRSQDSGAGERPLDEITRDLLRPMLAEWLDTNLPPLVERLVQAEIKRIIGIGR